MTERELARGAARRLAIIRHAQEVTGNVSLTCRYYGISRQIFYKWLRRYEEQGIKGLRERSRAPHHRPRATRTEVVGKIIYLRENYHFGPHKISMYLRRYHDITLSPSGVWNILRRLGMSRLPSSQRYKRHTERWKRYEKPLPGHRVQVDVKFIAPLKGNPEAPLPVHRRRRLHPSQGPQDLRASQPEDGHPVHRLRTRAASVQSRDGSDGQRIRVPSGLSLARPGPRDPARLHQAEHS